MKKYVIYCGSRSGSSYLCELLRSTKRLGKPAEYFNDALIDGYRKCFGMPDDVSHRDYALSIIKNAITDNEIFGVKVVGHRAQMDAFRKSKIQPTHYIWLRREDVLLQAISRYKAWMNNKWDSSEESKKTNLHVVYDFKNIDWCVKEIEEENAFFERFFKDKEALEIWYEGDLCESPDQTVISILSYFGVSTEDLPFLSSKSVVLRDHKAEEWKHRYLRDSHII